MKQISLERATIQDPPEKQAYPTVSRFACAGLGGGPFACPKHPQDRHRSNTLILVDIERIQIFHTSKLPSCTRRRLR